jgi:hypothetical protein
VLHPWRQTVGASVSSNIVASRSRHASTPIKEGGQIHEGDFS